jgi:hypothetical protein
MKRIVIGIFLLFKSVAHAQTSVSETMTYQAVTAASPTAVSRLRVTPVDSNGYAIDFSVVAPTRTQHTGHIQGFATRNGDRIILRVPNFLPDGNLDRPPLCTLVIDVNETSAKVVSEYNCAFYCGAGASFFEQGQNLLRVP